MPNENGKMYSLTRVIVTGIICTVFSLALSSLVMLGADRQRLAGTEQKLDQHIILAEEKIRELNILTANQASVAEHLRSIDATLKDIKDEIKSNRFSK